MKTRFLAAFVVCLLVVTTRAETVSLTAGDPFGDSSFTNGVRWSNSAVPSAGIDYTVALGADALLRAPFATNTNAKSTWTGGPLTLGSDAAAGWLEIPVACKNGSGDVPSQWYDRVEVGDITIRNGGIVFPYGRYSGLIGTSLTVDSASEAVVKIGGKWPDGTEGESLVYFGTALKGDSSQTVRFVKSDTATKAAYVSLFKDNSGFKGQMIFDGVGLEDVICETLNANRFGGDPGYFRPDALYFPNGFAYDLSVREGSRNNNTARTLQPHANRGITFKGGGSIGGYLSNTWTVNVPIVGDTLKVTSGISKFDGYTSGLILFNKQLTVDEVTFGSGYSPRLQFGEDITDESCCLVKLTNISTVGCRGTCKVRVEATTGCFLESRSNSEATSAGHLIVTPDSVLTNATVKEVTVLSSGAPAYGFAKVWWPIATIPKKLVAQDKILVRNLQNQEVTYPYEVRDEGDNWVVYIKKAETSYTYVVPAGTPGNEPEAPYNSWATAANDIPTAIAAATAGASSGARGGTVLVAPGTYDITSPILLEKRIQLRSCNPETGLIDPEHTILDGGYPARTNRIMKLKTAQVAGFTFRHGATTATGSYNGHAPGGGAVDINNDNEWRIRNCIFRENHAINTYGGAIGCFMSSGYGLWSVTDCLFENNSTLESGSGGAYGSGLSNGDTSGVGFRNCVFRNNTAATTGGAAFNGRPLYFMDCTFVDNFGAKDKHQIGSFNLGRCVRCVFEQTGGEGPLLNGNVAYDACEFRNISCPGQTIHKTADGKSSVLPLQFKNCIVTNCTAGYWISGVNFSGNVPVDSCLVAGNAFGNLVSIHSVGFDFTGCTVANNKWSFDSFYSYLARDCSIVNSIFWNNVNTNKANYTLERFLNAEAGGKLAVENSIVTTTNLTKAAKSLSNAWVRAPGFVGNGDVHLRDGAFAREKGLMLDYCKGDSCVDLDGLPRRVDRDGCAYTAAALPDLGCYEAQGKTPGFLLLLR